MDSVLDALGPVLGKLPPETESKIRDALESMKDILKKSRITGEAGAGMIKLVTNGYGEPISVEIDDLVFKETEKQLISDLFCSAIRDNSRRCKENAIKVESDLRYKMIKDKSG